MIDFMLDFEYLKKAIFHKRFNILTDLAMMLHFCQKVLKSVVNAFYYMPYLLLILAVLVKCFFMSYSMPFL